MVRDNRLPLLVLFGLMLLATVAAYWPGLHGGFELDDYQNLHPLLQIFDHHASVWGYIWSSNAGPLRRPIAMASLVANMVFEGPDVFAFKFTNLMIHLLCGVLVFGVSTQVFARWRPHWSLASQGYAALLVSALWLLAPLLTSTTLYIIQRMAQLSALFSLAGLMSYFAGRRRLDTHFGAGVAFLMAAVLVWMPLAGLSKENGFILPLILAVVEWTLYAGEGNARTRRFLAIYFAIFLGLPAIGTLVILAWKPALFLASYVGRPFTLPERLLTETRVLFYYVRNLLIPNTEGMGVFHDDYVVSRSLFHPWTTATSIAGWLLVLFGVYRSRRSPHRALWLGPLFFLAAQSLESTFLPLELVFEYRNYLPAVGIFLGLVMALVAARERYPVLRRPLMLLMVLLPLFYGFSTYERARVWSNWASLLLTSEAAHPRSPRVHIEAADLYMTLGNRPKALSELADVERLSPDAAGGVSLQRLGLYCQAPTPPPLSDYAVIPTQATGTEAGIYVVAALRSLTAAIGHGRCPHLNLPLLADRLQEWIRHAPPDHYHGYLWDYAYETGEIQWFAGRAKSSYADFRIAASLAPKQPQPLLEIMGHYVDQNRLREAYETWRSIQKIDASHDPAVRAVIAPYQALGARLDQLEGHKRQ